MSVALSSVSHSRKLTATEEKAVGMDSLQPNLPPLVDGSPQRGPSMHGIPLSNERNKRRLRSHVHGAQGTVPSEQKPIVKVTCCTIPCI